MESSVSFRPPWYLRSGHFQTLLTVVYRPKLVLTDTSQYSVPLPGNVGATYLYENAPAEGTHSRSLSNYDPSHAVLLLHGLGSSHSGAYMNNIAARLVAQGHRVIRVDLPGSGPSSSLTWLPAHAGCSEEMWAILDWCHQNLGIETWRGIGFSLGGNLLLKMLADHAGDLTNQRVPWTFKAALAVAPPIDLAACCDGMEQSINRWYAKHFLKILMAEVERRSNSWERWAKIPRIPKPMTIRQFDDRFTAPLAGFHDSEEYYRHSSSGTHLKKISTPTIILGDRHDPIVPARIFRLAFENPCIQMKWTQRGGHLGYLHRTKDGRYVRWADEWVAGQIMELNPS